MGEDYFRKGLVTSIIILFIGTNIVPNICGNNEDKEYFTYESGNLTITYHLATREEIEEMKKDEGVYDPDKDYNHIVNGKGTGLLPPTEEEWDAMVGTLKIADKVQQPLSLPSEKDLTEDLCFPAVGKQRGQSCVAWSLTYYTNGYLQARQHNWDDAYLGTNKSQLLSPYWTYNLCNYGYDYGTSSDRVAYCMNKTGSCTNATFPFQGYTSWGDEEAWRDAPQYRCGDYFEIIKNETGKYTDANVNFIEAKINANVPVPLGIKTGIYGYLNCSDEVLGVDEMTWDGYGHMNTIVGFNDSIENPNESEVGAFKVINSWGKGPWGGLYGYPNADCDQDGCYWITYDAFKNGTGVSNVCYIEDYYINDEYPQLVGVWEFSKSKCPPRNTSVKLSLWNRDVGGDPVDTREPYWEVYDHTDNRFPNFMCLDVTEFFQPWASSGYIYNFSIDLGEPGQEWLEGKKIESFVIEYYENEYSLGEPSQKSRKTEPDLEGAPLDLPCRVYVKDFNYSSPPTNLVLTGTFENIEGGRIYDYNFSADDPGDELYYYWDWGDGNNTGWRGPFISEHVDPQEKGWEFERTYYMTVIAEDVGGFRNVIEKTIEVEGDNDIPNDPAAPTIEKKQGNTYYLNTTTTDPEENDVFHHWGWRRWIFYKCKWDIWKGQSWNNDPDCSGVKHTYEKEFEKGIWQVRVQARDIWEHIMLRGKNTSWVYSTSTWVNYASGCPEGTQVNMAQGSFPVTKNIENIVVGDIIQSYDVTSELLVPAEVIAVHEYTQELPETLLDINYNIGNNIEVTSDHFLFINGTEWIETGDARIGYYLLENPPGTGDTFLKQITSINESSLIAASIYDLEIIPVTSENVSGYFADSVLVGGFI